MPIRSQYYASLDRRLQESISQINQVRELCQVPSVSFGVVHEGKVLLRQSVGYRDAEQRFESDADTIYMLGSCSKMFTSAAVAILVHEGKLQWQDPIQKYLPEFNPVGDPEIGQNADLIDVLRHSTGVASPGALFFGPRGSILASEEDVIKLLNMMPTTNKDGQKFNRHWEYNNFTYGLMAKVVEKVTGQRFTEFLRERILNPLGMTRTALTRADIADDDNVAVPCATLDNGKFVQLDSESWPCEDHPPLLAATGMRSSLNDMLNWCIAVLSAERRETHSQCKGMDEPSPISNMVLPDTQTNLRNNPLRQMNRVRRGYWTRPADDPSFSKNAAYCMGWVRMELPSSMLGAFSGNYHSRAEDHQMHLKHILGMKSHPFLAIGHTGGMPGSIATVWTFPDTQSAVVTMTNGRSFGDASDFAAQILIQALFDLAPRIDLSPWMKMEADLARRFFYEDLLKPWKENQRLSDAKRDPMIYVGEYCGFDGLFTLSIIADMAPGDSDGELAVVFNHRQASRRPLIFYRKDTYSFFFEDWNNHVVYSVGVKDYRQTLLEFEIDYAAEQVTGLWWRWSGDTDEKPAWLRRVSR
ncbi:hypothetical protein Asppvi_009562 [Aspergillus pseudoviridinutans]|uniref:Beta-lactamase-related domain-containing protein n=1 Tax=Aspergillus pseudoviridinutans TaxID=1517512 RepID=A0A9P3BG08_9EURO|nr:uncharacterized protein Asppvi_009562 [Aspergillus pseudoviridinutans]GIJ90601.1 hypothetical protein Asppvi_009562 [Aspergillus pseudoviridinutans]